MHLLFIQLLILVCLFPSFAIADFDGHKDCPLLLLAEEKSSDSRLDLEKAARHFNDYEVLHLGYGRFSRVERVKSPDFDYVLKTYRGKKRLDLDFELIRSLLPYSNPDTLVVLDVAKVGVRHLARRFVEGPVTYRHDDFREIRKEYPKKVRAFIESLGVEKISMLTDTRLTRYYYRNDMAWKYPVYAFQFQGREVVLKADNIVVGPDRTFYLIDPF